MENNFFRLRSFGGYISRLHSFGRPPFCNSQMVLGGGEGYEAVDEPVMVNHVNASSEYKKAG